MSEFCIACDARDEFIVTGSTDTFTLSFNYVESSDVNVAIKESGVWTTVPRDRWTFENLTTIKISPPPRADVTIYRCTDISQAQAVFFPGNSVKADDLNANQRQVLNAIAELRCSIANLELGGGNGGGDTGGIGEPCDQGECEGNLVCFEGICLQTCADGNCPTGYECVAGYCLPTCLTGVCEGGFDCIDGICLPPPDSDGDCPTGYSNIGGVCLPDCVANTDCPDGFDCGSDGTCYPSCDASGSCPQGFICEGGLCKPVFTDDAPADGLLYGRKNDVWQRTIPRDFSTLPALGATTTSISGRSALDVDAPIDNFTYGRINGSWDKAAVYPDTLQTLPAGEYTGCTDGTGANSPDGPLWIAWQDPANPSSNIVKTVSGLVRKVASAGEVVINEWSISSTSLAISFYWFDDPLFHQGFYNEFYLQSNADPTTRCKIRLSGPPINVNNQYYELNFTPETDVTPLVNLANGMGVGLDFLFDANPDIHPWEIVEQEDFDENANGTGYLTYDEDSYPPGYVPPETFPPRVSIRLNARDSNGDWVMPPGYSSGTGDQNIPFWVSSDTRNWTRCTFVSAGYGTNFNGSEVIFTGPTFGVTTRDVQTIRALGFGYCATETCDDFVWDCYPQSIELYEGGCYDARATTHGCSRSCIGGNDKGDLAYKWEEKINGSWVVFQDWSRRVTHTFFTDGLKVGDTRIVRVTARCTNFPPNGVVLVGNEIVITVVDCSLLPSVEPAPEGSLPNIPNDGLMYGRRNSGWNKILQYAITDYPTLPN